MKMTCIRRNCLSLVISGLAGLLPPSASAYTNVVEKVADLSYSTAEGGSVGVGFKTPLSRVVQVGTNLFFTTSSGGAALADGVIGQLSLGAHALSKFSDLDQSTVGSSPQSPLLVIGDEGYFTTTKNGAGSTKGALAKINLTNGVLTLLHSLNTDGSEGQTPRGGITQIGDDLWFTTSLGGTSNRGVVAKFSLISNNFTVVTNFDGPKIGGQCYSSLVKAGNAWYYTTLTGGSNFGTTSIQPYTLSDGSTVWTTNSLSLGGGVLGRMTFDNDGNPVFTQLVNLPGGFGQFSGNDPVLVGTNSLYFTTVGPNSTPGAIVRYDISTGFWTNLFLFTTNADRALAYGKQPGYNSLTEWQGELYFTTRQGGTANLGIIAKYNIASNMVIKLADLEGTTNLALGSESGGFNTGTVIQETNRYYMYFPLAAGGSGAGNAGTIVRVSLSPPPIQSSLSNNLDGSLTLSWAGGYEPFTVQSRTNLLSGSWADELTALTNHSASFPMGGDQGFFRVVGSE